MLEWLLQLMLRRREQLLGLTPISAESSATLRDDIEVARRQGNVYLAAGELAEAEGEFRRALTLDPGDVQCLVCLGYVLKEQGRLSEARLALRRALDAPGIQADAHETHYLFGQISELQGDQTDALRHFEASLQIKDDFIRACRDICRIHHSQGQTELVRVTLERCTQRSPSILEYRLWLGDLYAEQADYDKAVDHLKIAVRLGAKGPVVHMTLGASLCRIGRIIEGAQYMALGVEMDSSMAYVAQYEIGYAHLTSGDRRLGREHLEKALALNPGFLPAHSSIVMMLSHSGERDEEIYRVAAQRYAAAAKTDIKKPLRSGREQSILKKTASTSKRLRVGFVSGDFRTHPVAHFLRDVLRYLDRERVCLIAYSNTPLEDETTQAVKALFDEWHSIRSMSDDAAAEMIAGHDVDVLFDLNGHTGETRLAIFARRPAPVQVSWLGFWASTGLSEMDYILADPFSVPVDSTQWFSEQVYRLPYTRLCMSVPQPSQSIDIGPPPALKNGFVTFGSFQQVSKITPQVLEVWAQILQLVPGSRLRLQTKNLSLDSVRDKLSQDMKQAGIDFSRLDARDGADLDAYLESHNEVDILLDTFPYPGGTTTAFALWMGVPTVTLQGHTIISRQGAAMLRCVGLDAWVAESEAKYVQIACSAAFDIDRLKGLRERLRDDSEKSPLFNAKQFAGDFERAIFAMSARKTSSA